MSLREDLETMERYRDAGLLREYLLGTAPPLPPEGLPADPSAGAPAKDTYQFIKQRGD